MSREQVDLDLIKRVCVSHNYISKRLIRQRIYAIISDGYYEDIIRLNSPHVMISTGEYIDRDQKFARLIKLDIITDSEKIKIFRKKDKDGKVLIRTSILDREGGE